MARDLLLVHPPEIDSPRMIPINLLLLAALARRAKLHPSILDLRGYDSASTYSADVARELATALEDTRPAVVGIPVHTVRSVRPMLELASEVKSIRPSATIVTGGVGATFMWKYLLDERTAAVFGGPSRSIDAVICGYADDALPAFVSDLKYGGYGQIAGVATRTDNGAIRVPLAAVDPAWNPLPDLTELNAPVSHYSPVYPLETSRGCRFACSFCTSIMPACQGAEAMFPTERVIAEIQNAVRAGFHQFYVVDNTFTSHANRVIDLCRSISANCKITWSAMTRADAIDVNVLAAMHQAGCVSLSIGLESISTNVRKSYQKGLTRDQVRRAIDLIRGAGLRAVAFVIVGGPDDSVDTLEETLEFAETTALNGVVASAFQPFPGTQYWTAPASYGLKEIEPFDRWSFFEGPVCATRNLTKVQVAEWLERFASFNERRRTLSGDEKYDPLRSLELSGA